VLVRLEEVAIGYAGRAVLAGVTLTVERGDFLGVVGPNGGGKTTLLRTLLGVLPPVRGRRVQPAPLRVGYVPQRDHVEALWPITVSEVVLMGRYALVGPGRRVGAEDRRHATAALGRLAIADLAGRPFRTLSGGQRQRTLIARALAAEPQLLALDEPTSGMDPSAELAAMDILADLRRTEPLAVIMVSHRLEAVANYANRLAFVDRDQALWRVGTLDEMLQPELLSALYQRPVVVREEEGRRLVYPGRAAPPRGSGSP
jgi:ABC-type Mn2+/Zn2+ transport system ATPase subunit